MDRAMRDSLAAYLVAEGMAEAEAGYGHATGEQVADAVMTFLGEWEAGKSAAGGPLQTVSYIDIWCRHKWHAEASGARHVGPSHICSMLAEHDGPHHCSCGVFVE